LTPFFVRQTIPTAQKKKSGKAFRQAPLMFSPGLIALTFAVLWERALCFWLLLRDGVNPRKLLRESGGGCTF